MFEIRNQDGSWPKTIELKLCVYPNTDDIKQWSFDMFDTVGKLETIIMHSSNVHFIIFTKQNLFMANKKICLVNIIK